MNDIMFIFNLLKLQHQQSNLCFNLLNQFINYQVIKYLSFMYVSCPNIVVFFMINIQFMHLILFHILFDQVYLCVMSKYCCVIYDVYDGESASHQKTHTSLLSCKCKGHQVIIFSCKHKRIIFFGAPRSTITSSQAALSSLSNINDWLKIK